MTDHDADDDEVKQRQAAKRRQDEILQQFARQQTKYVCAVLVFRWVRTVPLSFTCS